jgi:hypothetical protein
MDDDGEPRTAIDAVRRLYLARVAEREGHREAAQRWQAKADLWMTRRATDSRGSLEIRTHSMRTDSDFPLRLALECFSALRKKEAEALASLTCLWPSGKAGR